MTIIALVALATIIFLIIIFVYHGIDEKREMKDRTIYKCVNQFGKIDFCYGKPDGTVTHTQTYDDITDNKK